MSDAVWNVLTVTRGGTVSILRNLTDDVARETVRRLTPFWQRPDANLPNGFTWTPQDSDIERIELIGPKGRMLQIWDYDQRAVAK